MFHHVFTYCLIITGTLTETIFQGHTKITLTEAFYEIMIKIGSL